MEQLVLSFKDVISKFSDSDIKKYNGKSVSISTLIEPLFCESNVLAIFRVSPFGTFDDVKLRSLLKTRSIQMRRFKAKQLKLFEPLVRTLSSTECVDFIFQERGFVDFCHFLEGSVVILEFVDVNHFLFFERFLLSRLEKHRFSFIALKLNNQYFAASSSFFQIALNSSKDLAYNLNRLKSVNFFQLLTVRNFLYFSIAMKYQLAIFEQEFKSRHL